MTVVKIFFNHYTGTERNTNIAHIERYESIPMKHRSILPFTPKVDIEKCI